MACFSPAVEFPGFLHPGADKDYSINPKLSIAVARNFYCAQREKKQELYMFFHFEARIEHFHRPAFLQEFLASPVGL